MVPITQQFLANHAFTPLFLGNHAFTPFTPITPSRRYVRPITLSRPNLFAIPLSVNKLVNQIQHQNEAKFKIEVLAIQEIPYLYYILS